MPLKLYLKIFEAENVENGYGGSFATLADNLIDSSHQPGEKGAVQSFGKSVPGVQGLVNTQRSEKSFISRLLKFK